MFVFFHGWPATGDKITKILILTSWELLTIYDESGKKSSNVRIIADQTFGLGNPDPFFSLNHTYFIMILLFIILCILIYIIHHCFYVLGIFPTSLDDTLPLSGESETPNISVCTLTEGASRPHYVVSHVSVHWSLVPGDQTGTPASSIVAYTVGVPWAAVLIGSH